MNQKLSFASIGGLLIVAVVAQAQESAFTVKTEKVAVPKELNAGIAALCSEDALQIQTDKGQAVATVWLSKLLPSKAAPEQVKSGLTYRELQQSTIVGAVQFPQAWTDYRNQRIAAGVYTLRYGLQPENGDHQGTAPFNDFCLLIPAAKDTKPDILDVKELHEFSSAAPGGTHPGVMLLFPNTKPAAQPKIETKPNALHVLYLPMNVAAGELKAVLGFGFVINGHAKE